ncbi:MAG: hypothetical protein IJ365_03945, partial [Clostridia bacterium]|nr:hypothetical protein [Clostridia bacterium]
AGHIAGEIDYSPTVVKLTGPRSVIQNVTTAVVNVDMTGAAQNIAGLYKIKLYDGENREIIDERISKNIEYCDIKCPVYATKQVSVTPILRSEVNSNNAAVTVSSVNPSAVTLIGSADLLETIDGIYTHDIDTHNITEHTKLKAALNIDDIPEGVTIQDDVKEVEIELSPETAADAEHPEDEQQENIENEQQNDDGGNE